VGIQLTYVQLISKAFDKVNHHALLIKLMKRKLPVIVLERYRELLAELLLVHVLSVYLSLQIRLGVRQGSALSPLPSI